MLIDNKKIYIQYCAKVLSHPLYLYILIGKWEVCASMCCTSLLTHWCEQCWWQFESNTDSSLHKTHCPCVICHTSVLKAWQRSHLDFFIFAKTLQLSSTKLYQNLREWYVTPSAGCLIWKVSWGLLTHSWSCESHKVKVITHTFFKRL